MKGFKLFVASVFLLTLVFAGVMQGRASAQRATPLSCVVYYFDQQEQYQFEHVTIGCDLSIKKSVSVNGGSFFDADTSADAVNASIGNSVTWKVVVNGSLPEVPIGGGTYHVGIARVSDLLPEGTSYVSHSASYGTFNSGLGFWDFEMNSEEPTFPIELTINTTAVSSGLHENQASLSGYDINLCGSEGPGPCGFESYTDSTSTNNSDSAWISVSAAPVVLGSSATATPAVQGLADTGDTIVQSVLAGSLIVFTAVLAFSSKLRRTKAD